MDAEPVKGTPHTGRDEANPLPNGGIGSAVTVSMDSPERFINRELSWLAFNERVLDSAENKKHPLLEQLRFLSISANNLNEFFMVRVAGLRGQVEAKVDIPSQEGLTPRQQLELVNARAMKLMYSQQKCWRRIVRQLHDEDIHVLESNELGPSDRRWLKAFFLEKLFSVLSPIAVDPAHPFPFIPNLGFALVVALKKGRKKETLNALVSLPHLVERFIRLPGEAYRFVALETVVAMHVKRLFPGFRVVEVGQCRVLRDSDIEIEEEAEDLVRLYESALKERRRGSVIRLTINDDMSHGLRQFLVEGLDAAPETVFALKGLLGLADTGELIVNDRPDLVFTPYAARFPGRVLDFGGDCFQAIKAKDFVVHHPYESFDVVVQFIRQAADDPDVIAIKQMLYRTSENSPIVAALIAAAEAGKSVTALVEVKARFDEERNIRWARDLERAGVQVVYGFVHLKTHAKISLVVRREGDQFQSYCHFGTGNYHPITARIYTDLSFFSCDPALCRDAAWLFHFTTGTAGPVDMEKLSVSPVNMREKLIELIDDEKRFVSEGRPGTIWVKLNSLVDGEIIDALYKASQAGVKIHLAIRGICCLRPGVPGLSDNITVQSMIGRFLEHARIVCFGRGHALPSEKAKVFISSADWMPRNLNRRVEIMVPIENATVHRQILEQIMDANFKDKVQSWLMQSDGTYRRRSRNPSSFSAYDYFMTNPSLSGLGSAREPHDPEPLQAPPPPPREFGLAKASAE